MLEDLTGRHDLSKDGLGTNYPYLPLTADEAWRLPTTTRSSFDQNGYEYVPGRRFLIGPTRTAYWQFLGLRHRHPSGLQRLGGLQQVLFSLIAPRSWSYPDEGCLGAHRCSIHRQRRSTTGLNSDFDDETQCPEAGTWRMCRQPCRRLHLAGHGEPERGHAQALPAT